MTTTSGQERLEMQSYSIQCGALNFNLQRGLREGKRSAFIRGQKHVINLWITVNINIMCKSTEDKGWDCHTKGNKFNM